MIMMNKEEIYQLVEFNFYAPTSSHTNHEISTNIKLQNDFSYDDLIEAFIEFSGCLGFNMKSEDIIKQIKLYIKENYNED